jgi:hypothetical protein
MDEKEFRVVNDALLFAEKNSFETKTWPDKHY